MYTEGKKRSLPTRAGSFKNKAIKPEEGDIIENPLYLNNNNYSKHTSDFDFFGEESVRKSDLDYKKIDFGSISNISNINKINFPNDFDNKGQSNIKTNKNEKNSLTTKQQQPLLNEDLQEYVSDLIELNELLKKENKDKDIKILELEGKLNQAISENLMLKSRFYPSVPSVNNNSNNINLNNNNTNNIAKSNENQNNNSITNTTKTVVKPIVKENKESKESKEKSIIIKEKEREEQINNIIQTNLGLQSKEDILYPKNNITKKFSENISLNNNKNNNINNVNNIVNNNQNRNILRSSHSNSNNHSNKHNNMYTYNYPKNHEDRVNDYLRNANERINVNFSGLQIESDDIMEFDNDIVSSGGYGLRFRNNSNNIVNNQNQQHNQNMRIINNNINNRNQVQAQPNLDNMTYEQMIDLTDRVGCVSKGLTQNDIDNLPLIKFIKNSELCKCEACAICQCDYIENESLRRLNCGHFYHSCCIDKWIKTDRKCPVCKKDSNA